MWAQLQLNIYYLISTLSFFFSILMGLNACVECVECLQSNVMCGGNNYIVLSQHTSLWKHPTQFVGHMHIVTETQHVVSITHLMFTTPESLFTLLTAIGSGYKMGGCFSKNNPHIYKHRRTHRSVYVY